ncbi:MAG: methionine--tRNA ligase, partial [Spirochaetales bacterium]|nr:methionine--tRNA ligase [Spirochaetales bacterium]
FLLSKSFYVKQYTGADKLCFEQIETSPGVTTQIVSGLAPYYQPQELQGRHVILAANLKPAKLRGEVSNGMLLAATHEGETETVEVIFADEIPVGTPLDLEGDTLRTPEAALKPQIKIDSFFEVPLRMQAGVLMTGDTALTGAGKRLKTHTVTDGSVG